MAAMDGMGASDASAMTHTMAPGAMGGHMHMMENHMRMTDLRPSTPEDEARARDILQTLRSSMARYHDYRVALAKGMRIFLPGIPQDVYHFTDYAQTGQEYQGRFDISHPGSLLYTRDAAGDYTLVGAMYSAPPEATPDDLDAIVPLSVARWHVHTNICLPNDLTIEDLLRNDIGADRTDMPGMLPVSASPKAVELNHRYGFLADGRFGFEGKISDAQTVHRGGWPSGRAGIRMDGACLSVLGRRFESRLRNGCPEARRRLGERCAIAGYNRDPESDDWAPRDVLSARPYRIRVSFNPRN